MMHRVLAGLIFAGLIALCNTPSTAVAKEEEAEIDYVGLAARLLADGHLDRAATALQSVDLKAEGVDVHRYYLLSGLVTLRQGVFGDAARHFQNAIKTPPQGSELTQDGKPKRYEPDPRLYLYLAQAEFGQQRWQETLAALSKGGRALDDEESAHAMRAQSLWNLKRPEEALSALVRATKRFPDTAQFERMQMFYYIELGLFQQATVVGERYLNRKDIRAEDFVAVGEALRRGKQDEKASVVLEAAHLRFPEDDQLLLALAHTYVDMGQTLAAAMILESAARLQPSYTVQAAEMYRQSKRLERALYLNERVEDQQAKFKQRLAILLDKHDFEQVAAMAPTIERLDLSKDDQIRYAMAFGFYKIGRYAMAEKYLRGIGDAKLFESAGGLRKAMQACPPNSWECM